jgi:hypothetical protein
MLAPSLQVVGVEAGDAEPRRRMVVARGRAEGAGPATTSAPQHSVGCRKSKEDGKNINTSDKNTQREFSHPAP